MFARLQTTLWDQAEAAAERHIQHLSVVEVGTPLLLLLGPTFQTYFLGFLAKSANSQVLHKIPKTYFFSELWHRFCFIPSLHSFGFALDKPNSLIIFSWAVYSESAMLAAMLSLYPALELLQEFWPRPSKTLPLISQVWGDDVFFIQLTFLGCFLFPINVFLSSPRMSTWSTGFKMFQRCLQQCYMAKLRRNSS